MAAHLARIRIAGFKSFADPVTLDVRRGSKRAVHGLHRK